jgi:hypothetical protein
MFGHKSSLIQKEIKEDEIWVMLATIQSRAFILVACYLNL